MIDRDQLTAEIYLRLMQSCPDKTPAWHREEARRLAEEFIDDLPKKAPRTKRREAVTA